MKNLLPLLVAMPLVFMACGKKSENQTDSSPGSKDTKTSTESTTSVGNTDKAFHSALAHVIDNLDTNGSHLSVTHIDQDLKQLAEAVDGLLDMARKESEDVPSNLSVVDLLGDVGLDEVDAMGRSSRWNDSAWHNRLFIQTGGKRSGLLSVMGGEGSKWRAGEIAPADADLVIEFEVNMRRLMQTIKLVTVSFGDEVQQSFADAMKEKIAGGAMTIGDLLGKMDLRASLVVSVDREKRWNVSEQIELPTMHAAMRIERAMWLWKQFGAQIEADAEVSERDGLKIVKAPKEMDTPMGKIRPIFILDESKDIMWVALTEEYLEKCRSPEKTLSSSDDFTKATAGFPDKGNGLFYVSGDFCKELVEQIKHARGLMTDMGPEMAIFDVLLGMGNISPDKVPHGYAWCVSNTKTGILSVANAPMPDKGYGMMSSIAPISAMAAMATPVIMKQKKKADQVTAVNNMKQMFYLLIEYDADFGEFPKQLSDLVKEGYIKEEGFTMLSQCKVDSGTKSLVYIPGYDTSKNSGTIIMHTPESIDGKYAYLRIDGAVKIAPEAEFKKLMEKQQSAD